MKRIMRPVTTTVLWKEKPVPREILLDINNNRELLFYFLEETHE